jgi:hypothetical protein
MPIDDALNDIDDALNEIKEKDEVIKKPKTSDKTVKELDKELADYIFNDYIIAMDRQTNSGKNYTDGEFDMNIVKKFSEFIRFKSDLSIQFMPIPREKYIDSIDDAGDLTYLLKHTNLGETLPPVIEINQNSLEKTADLIPTISDLFYFQECSEEIFIIPNLKLLSIFLGEKEKIRKYNEIIYKSHSKIYLNNYLIINNDEGIVECDIPEYITSFKSLREFYDQTKINDIKNISINLQNFVKLSNKWADDEELHESTKFLFKALEKNSPELVYEEKQNANR